MSAWALLLYNRARAHPSPQTLLSSLGLPRYLSTPVSSNPAAAPSTGKGNAPRRPPVTEPCIRALRRPLLQQEKRRNQSAALGCIKAEKDTFLW